MRDKNWPFEWLGQLKRDVDHLATMIYATKNEIKSLTIKEARKDLEKVLQDGWNQVISSRTVIAWLKQVREKIEAVGIRLELAAKIINKGESRTQAAAKRAHRLAGRIDSTIGLIENALNKMGEAVYGKIKSGKGEPCIWSIHSIKITIKGSSYERNNS